MMLPDVVNHQDLQEFGELEQSDPLDDWQVFADLMLVGDVRVVVERFSVLSSCSCIDLLRRLSWCVQDHA